MSKINELIQTLCPDVVEYKLFGDVASICRGASPRPIKQFVTEDAEGVNWIKIGDTKVGSKYITETAEKITEAGAKKSRYVHIGDFIMSNSMSFGRPYICQIEGCIHDGWLAISEFHDSFNSDFLYYLLCSTMVQKIMEKKASNGGAVSNLNADIVRALELPVPPLPVQEEIVRILDEYTDLEAELEAKLSEEVELKQKQYMFYMDKLLTFGDTVEWKRLSDCCKNIGDGLHGTPVYDLISNYYFINGNNLKNKKIVIDEKTKRVNEESFIKYMLKLDSSTLLMSINGTIGNLAMYHGENVILGKSVAYMSVLDSVLRRDFLYYLLQTTYTKQSLFQNVTGGTIKNLGLAVIRNFQIPVPSITEQERIVKILDKYDTYTRGMISTLNTELESRKKQYAYYRDQLLTFKRKE